MWDVRESAAWRLGDADGATEGDRAAAREGLLRRPEQAALHEALPKPS